MQKRCNGAKRDGIFFCMPAIDISGCCIPAECNNIKLPYNGEIASRWDAYLLCDICRHFASVMLHFASLISHNLRCIPAYAHQIPTGFFSIITKLSQGQLVYHFLFFLVGVQKKLPAQSLREKRKITLTNFLVRNCAISTIPQIQIKCYRLLYYEKAY